jgi:hypothetical protein
MDLQGPGLDEFGSVLVLPREIPRRNSCAESDKDFRESWSSLVCFRLAPRKREGFPGHLQVFARTA